MRFPVDWLREFVSISLSSGELASRLTQSGLVVDAVEGQGEDTVLEVDVPTNRPDAMNIYGVAREIAAATGTALVAYPAGAAEEAREPDSSKAASVAIEAGDMCGRYCARVIRGVQVGPTPDWMALRLRNAGLNVLNSIVDITNYVLWELGHPLHAFDLATLDGARIIVRRAARNESLVTLDGIHRKLDPEMLVIADGRRPVALAGIMGGADTMISEGTTDVLLESAHFDPLSVRLTAKRLALSTDASYRFERGADMEAAHLAIDRAAALIAEIAGGKVAPGIIDVRVEPPPPPGTLRLRLIRASTLLGMDLDAEQSAAALEALGFGASPTNGALDVTVPSYRQDVQGEADLAEEVGRIVGYDSIPERLPNLPGQGAIHRFAHRREDELRDSLLASGFTEVMSFPFVSGDLDALGQLPGRTPLKLSNPMVEGQEIMRTTLLPGLAAVVRRNLRHGVRDVRVFEMGRTFYRSEAGKYDAVEPLTCGIASIGQARPRHWSEPPRETALFDLKGALEEGLARVRIEASFGPLEEAGPFRPGTGLRLESGGRTLGRLGEISPSVAAKLGLKDSILFAEVNLTDLFSVEEDPPRFIPLPRYPVSTRDLALVVPHGVHWADVESAIRAAGGDLVSQVTLFDRYTGSSLEKGHVSLAVSIVYKHAERTLAAEEVEAAESKVLGALKDRFRITLRR
jgi:phenylalanyl-tRNA synthetase beta chain